MAQRAKDNLPIEPEHIGRAENKAERRTGCKPATAAPGTDQHQKLAHKARSAGQADAGHRKEHEQQRIAGHKVGQSAVAGDLTGMQPVVNHADDQEQCARDQTVAEHLEQSTRQPLRGKGENPHRHKGHMRDRRVGDELLHVLLHQRHQRGVNHGNNRQHKNERCQQL